MMMNQQRMIHAVACPICKGSPAAVKYRLSFQVYQCPECGFQFCLDTHFDPTSHANLNEANRERSLKRLRKENFQRIIESIRRYKDQKDRGLEVGSGHGWFLELCRDQAIQCAGIEPETLFNSRYKKAGLEIINGFYPTDISPQLKFDYIVFNDVLEHLSDQGSVMAANRTLLNAGGLLIVNLPIQEGILYFLAKCAYRLGVKSLLNRMWQFHFPSPHLSYFTKKTLLGLVSQNGFRVLESYKLKTVHFSEISPRLKEDNTQGIVSRMVVYLGVLAICPLLPIFPDTYCFVCRKSD